METIRAIFIDAKNRNVSEIQVENKLEAFYEKICCSCITTVMLGKGICMILDDEGLYTQEDYFRFRDSGMQDFAGNALLVGVADDGNFKDSSLSVKIAEIIEFLKKEESKTEPMVFFVPTE